MWSKWVRNSQPHPAREGEPDSGVLICKMGATVGAFTDACGGGKMRGLPAAREWDFFCFLWATR